jgi:hypothetical protein
MLKEFDSFWIIATVMRYGEQCTAEAFVFGDIRSAFYPWNRSYHDPGNAITEDSMLDDALTAAKNWIFAEHSKATGIMTSLNEYKPCVVDELDRSIFTPGSDLIEILRDIKCRTSSTELKDDLKRIVEYPQPPVKGDPYSQTL